MRKKEKEIRNSKCSHQKERKSHQPTLTSADSALMFHHLAGGSCHTPTRTWFPRLPAWPPGSGFPLKPSILQLALDYHVNLTRGLHIEIPATKKYYGIMFCPPNIVKE